MMRTFIIFILSLIPGTLFAQVTSSATTSATIVSEVGITELQGNNLITFATAKYDLQIINSARISMLTNINPIEILYFKVISNENDFSVTFPPSLFIKKDDDSGFMTVEFFITPYLDRKNSQPLSINSIFKGNNFQVPGNYYSAPFEITINYN